MRTIYFLSLLLISLTTVAQTVIKGKVVDESAVPILGANVIIKGTSVGTATDFDGFFTLSIEQNLPVELEVSSVGFESQTIQVTSASQDLTIILKEGSELDEVVISASRTPERIFESPVTVERFGIKEIKNTASANFYDGLENLKGVDINTNSLTFKSINTRGFATFANTRFMQLVDGMDNAAPALNFPLGNLLGMIDIDVRSVELLPGAASALYGANAFNGILFMRSKSPFDDDGLSAYVKRGFTDQEAAGTNPFTDVGIRAAHKFSEKFAAKINFGYLTATDWWANSEVGKINPSSTRENDINYDGINVYGDEVSTNIRAASGGLGIIPDVNVSRTGYNEEDLTNYNAESVKVDWGFYFRPWENDFEIVYQGKIGSGSTIYQGANRYSIRDFFLSQHKLEFRNDNFFVRGYVNEDNAGDSYDMVFTGININRAWKSDEQWFGEYIQTFAGATLSGASVAEAHAAARAQAESGRLVPGTPEFEQTFNEVISNPDLSSGSKFQDNSKFYHADVNYNFSHLIDVAEIQVGGSFREYELNSFGTIYTDSDGPINYSEVGVYTQIQKNLELNEATDLKLTGSIRYDKSELFDGFFSPRLSAGITFNDNHNIRASFQTGFRNPTTQDLFIGLDVGRAILVGGAEENLEREVRTFNVSPEGQTFTGQSSIEFTGSNAYNNSYLASSVQAFSASGDINDLLVGNSNLATPEQVTSLEVGYRGKLDILTVDASAYYNMYQDFLANETVIAPFYGNVDADGDGIVDVDNQAFFALSQGDFQAYQTYTNSTADINSYGAAIGLNAKVFGGFDLGANYTYAKLDFDQEEDPDFRPQFNTPEHKVKASFGHTDIVKNLGFNIAWRWSDTYLWQSSFGDGQIPAFHVVDAQINYTVPKIKSSFKLGAANLLGDEYYTAFGTGFIGSQYYVSWTINNL